MRAVTAATPATGLYVVVFDDDVDGDCAACMLPFERALAYAPAAYARSVPPRSVLASGEFRCRWHLECLLRLYVADVISESPTRTVATAVHDTDVCLLDFLDTAVRAELWRVLADTSADGLSLVYVNAMHAFVCAAPGYAPQLVAEVTGTPARAAFDAMRAWAPRPFDLEAFRVEFAGASLPATMAAIGARRESPRFPDEMAELVPTLSHMPNGATLVEHAYATHLAGVPVRVQLEYVSNSSLECVAAHQRGSPETRAGLVAVYARRPHMLWPLVPYEPELAFETLFEEAVVDNHCKILARIARALNMGDWCARPSDQQWSALMLLARTASALATLRLYKDAPPLRPEHLAALPAAEQSAFAAAYLTRHEYAKLAADGLRAGLRLGYYTDAKARADVAQVLRAARHGGTRFDDALATVLVRAGGRLDDVLDRHDGMAFLYAYYDADPTAFVTAFPAIATAVGEAIAWPFITALFRASRPRRDADAVEAALVASTLPHDIDAVVTAADEAVLVAALAAPRERAWLETLYARAAAFEWSGQTLRLIRRRVRALEP